MRSWPRALVCAALVGLAGCGVDISGLPAPSAGGPEGGVAGAGGPTDGPLPIIDAPQIPDGMPQPDRPPNAMVDMRPADMAAPVDMRQPDMAPMRDGPPAIPDVRMDGPRFVNGAACSADQQCMSGFCVDEVCCETRCAGVCMACSRLRTNQTNGLCRPVPAGTPSAGECQTESPNSCRQNGTCNGAGGCALYPANTVCGSSTCNGGTFIPAPRCNGTGTCAPRTGMPCPGSLVCDNGSTCKTRCAGDSDCTGGLTCDVATGQCQGAPPKKALGQTCDAALMGNDCLSGFCADGVCCDGPCAVTCRACVSAKTGQPDGRCSFIPAGQDPDNHCPTDDPATCGRDGTCNGSGTCRRYPDGTVCGNECCTRMGMGNRALPCSYTCSAGMCNRSMPVYGTACSAAQCCCPTGGAGGVPACTLQLTCPVNCQ